MNNDWKFYSNQIGSVNCLDEKSFSYDCNKFQLKNGFNIQDGRDFNLILHSLAALFIFLAVTQAKLHLIAAIFAGIMLGTHAIPVEFAHYCETDTALVFSLSLFALAITSALRKNSIVLTFISLFIAGFAFSCKYTLAPLVLFIPLCTFLQYKQWSSKLKLSKKISFTILFFLFSIITFLAGFIYGTPSIYKDFAFFIEASRQTGIATYEETTAILGKFANIPGMRTKFRFATMMDEIPEIGYLTLVWLAISCYVILYKKCYHKFIFSLPIFLIFFLAFACIGMPWIRSQELLPIVVSIAFLSAFPVDLAIRNIRLPLTKTPKWAILLCFIGTLTLIQSIFNGSRMSSAFSNRETVAECQNWMKQSVDSSFNVAYDRYVTMVGRGIPSSAYSLGRVDQNYPQSIQSSTNEISLFLRNKYFIGREPNRHPFTRELLPNAQKSVNKFSKECILLKTWEPILGKIRPVFNQASTELWYIPSKTYTPLFDIPIHYERPIFCRHGKTHYYGSWQIAPFGPDYGMLVSKSKSTFHPQFCKTNNTWFVVRSFSTKTASLSSSRFLSPSTEKLPPKQATAFLINNRKLAFVGHYDLKPGTIVKSKKRHSFLDLIGSTTATPSEVAFLLRKYGNPSKALNFLKNNGIDTESEKVEAFLAANECGAKIDVEWVKSAKEALDSYTKAVSAQKKDIYNFTISGIPAEASIKFSHLRFTPGEAPVILFKGEYDIVVKFANKIPQKATEIPFLTIQKQPAVQISDTTVAFQCKIDNATEINYLPSLMDTDFWWELGKIKEIEVSWNPLKNMEQEVNEIKRYLK